MSQVSYLELYQEDVSEESFTVKLPAMHNYEREALLEALRRDLRHQKELRSNSDGDAKQLHGYNAHLDMRLLELIQPKAKQPALSAQSAQSAVVAIRNL